jgi:hypothetical protein
MLIVPASRRPRRFELTGIIEITFRKRSTHVRVLRILYGLEAPTDSCIDWLALSISVARAFIASDCNSVELNKPADLFGKLSSYFATKISAPGRFANILFILNRYIGVRLKIPSSAITYAMVSVNTRDVTDSIPTAADAPAERRRGGTETIMINPPAVMRSCLLQKIRVRPALHYDRAMARLPRDFRDGPGPAEQGRCARSMAMRSLTKVCRVCP